jgi:tellurite methyltransferase
MDVPFWEKSYKDPDASAFGTEPNAAVAKHHLSFKREWSVLEAGCGESRNLIFLAKNGLKSLSGFDISPAAIEKSRKLAEYANVSIDVWVDDLRSFAFARPFDLIMSFGSLHLLEKSQWKAFIEAAKRNTKPGGMNIFQIFTNTVPASPDIAPFVKGLADDKELEESYKDWKIVDFESKIFEDVHSGVEPHFHSSNTIIARRIR